MRACVCVCVCVFVTAAISVQNHPLPAMMTKKSSLHDTKGRCYLTTLEFDGKAHDIVDPKTEVCSVGVH